MVVLREQCLFEKGLIVGYYVKETFNPYVIRMAPPEEFRSADQLSKTATSFSSRLSRLSPHNFR